TSEGHEVLGALPPLLPDSVAVADDIRHQGNASAASIPLAMATLLEEKPYLHGGTALLAGLGAGLAFGAQVVTLPAL
ncbi:3-oxoacyl-[acyl-carrier-protein] synthase III C-terminal domain-containing protein, partial [Nocardia sp. NPDC059764]|uniref:3-oxoacyl-[acyl-carrier-protein] synthase III C-terminal domain-containing protein n=1 Tax=Nocardia sp. NPDC059764 TaxID=3346939 RepID=UPI00365CD123